MKSTAFSLLLLAAFTLADPPQRLEHKGAVHGVAFGSDGRLYTACEDGSVRVFDLVANQVVNQHVIEEGRLTCIAFSGTTFFCGSGTGRIVMDDTASDLSISWDAHKGRVVDIAVNGKRLLTAGNDGTVIFHKLDHDMRKPPFPPALWTGTHKTNVLCCALSPDGKLAASGDSDGVVILWDTATGKEKQRIQAHRWFVGDLAFSPDGKYLATCSKTRECTIHTLDGKTPPLTMKGGTKLYAVAFSPDGKRIACGGRQDFVKIFDTQTGTAVAELKDPQPDDKRGFADMKFSPDGKHLAVAHFDGIVRVWPLGKRPEK